MIPTVDEILRMLVRGDCTHEQAKAWIEQHLQFKADDVLHHFTFPRRKQEYREE